MTFPTAPAPHAVAHDSVGRVMRIVLYALVPTVALHVLFFGVGLLVQIALGAATALLAEALALRLRHKPLEPFLKDGSAIVTAVLLALCLPPLAPWWLVVSGTAFAILLAKHLFGGLGANPFNPAMVGYAVLLVSFPVQLLQWLPPAGMEMEHVKLSVGETIQTILTGSLPSRLTWDAVTSPTPLDALQNKSEDGHDHGRGACGANLRHARRSRLGVDQPRRHSPAASPYSPCASFAGTSRSRCLAPSSFVRR